MLPGQHQLVRKATEIPRTFPNDIDEATLSRTKCPEQGRVSVECHFSREWHFILPTAQRVLENDIHCLSPPDAKAGLNVHRGDQIAIRAHCCTDEGHVISQFLPDGDDFEFTKAPRFHQLIAANGENTLPFRQWHNADSRSSMRDATGYDTPSGGIQY